MKKAVFYSGRYCGPCIEMKETIGADPALKKVIKVIDCDSKAGSKLADAAKIKVTPTFVREDGKRLEGVPSAARLKKFLEGA
jgi:protein-disulfide isomerase